MSNNCHHTSSVRGSNVSRMYRGTFYLPEVNDQISFWLKAVRRGWVKLHLAAIYH